LTPSDHGAGVLAATEHRWDDAEKQFRIVLDEEPDSASAWSNLGNVHLSKGRPNEAFRDFSEAVRLAPTVSGIRHLTVSKHAFNPSNNLVFCVLVL